MDASSVDSVFIALAFIVPGFVIYSLKSRFFTGHQTQTSEQLIVYLTYSAINYAIFSWLVYLLLVYPMNARAKAFGWTIVVLIGPAMLGTLYGVAIRKEWEKKVFEYFNLHPTHLVPTAWDWKFGRQEDLWVLVTLKDDTRFAGRLGASSFISSEPSERDIYIEKVYNLLDTGDWEDVGGKSVLISGGEIKTVEFWPVQGVRDERK